MSDMFLWRGPVKKLSQDMSGGVDTGQTVSNSHTKYLALLVDRNRHRELPEMAYWTRLSGKNNSLSAAPFLLSEDESMRQLWSTNTI